MRRDLPWRRTRDPYAIWISEMMLQQTQVATATPYWERWMERFPDVVALADAPVEEVLKAWEGLGYYARARNLHRAARQIVEHHGGVFPRTHADILALPGVGRYTAGAICSIALGLDTPLVDANVVRVLCRLDAVSEDPKSASVQERLWERAAQLLPPGEAGDFNQALMELGALVCQPAPKCGACPWEDACAARAGGDPARFPRFAPKPAPTLQTDVCAVVRRGGGILLTRRPHDGLWGGLYELPRVTARDGESPQQAAERAARDVAGLNVQAGETVASLRHGVTTRRITLVGVACAQTEEGEPEPRGCDAVVWAEPADRDRFPLSSPQGRLWEKLTALPDQLRLF